MSEQRLSGLSGSGVIAKRVENDCFFSGEISLEKEALGNGCIEWLSMLFYEGSSLNGLCFPLGIETILGPISSQF